MHELKVLRAVLQRRPDLIVEDLGVSVFLESNHRGSGTPAVAVGSAKVAGERCVWIGRYSGDDMTHRIDLALGALIEAIATRPLPKGGHVEIFDAT